MKMILRFIVAFAVALPANVLPKDESADVWKPLRALIGKWEGDVSGQPGVGKVEREYAFVLRDRFIHAVNTSIYPPQEKNPKGERHEDVSYFSYDKATRKLMLRQFHVEGFVNTFALESVSDDQHTIVFTSTAIENIAPGWRAREVYHVVNESEFTETFSLAEPGHEFSTYSETRFRRRK